MASPHEVFEDDQIDTESLRSKRLFKTLSLVLAARNSIPVPQTLLMVASRPDVVKQIVDEWHLPVMIRMDYSSLPASKPLGGIPLRSVQAISAVANFLFQEGYFPLLHPHLDRFEDVYSVNMMVNRTDFKVLLEVVGRGFDASDLRLGAASPHESLTYDLVEDAVVGRRLISDSSYCRERVQRAERATRYKKYVEYANQTYRLLSSLKDLKVDDSRCEQEMLLIPDSYSPLHKSHLRSLAEIAWQLRTGVVGILPPSESFVGSMSFLPEKGWVLWDIYGQWYRR